MSGQRLRILRRKQLEDLTGLSRTTIYDRLNPKSNTYDPTFPKPVELGVGMKNPPVGWIESEVETWLQNQVAKRAGNSAKPSHTSIAAQA